MWPAYVYTKFTVELLCWLQGMKSLLQLALTFCGASSIRECPYAKEYKTVYSLDQAVFIIRGKLYLYRFTLKQVRLAPNYFYVFPQNICLLYTSLFMME